MKEKDYLNPETIEIKCGYRGQSKSMQMLILQCKEAARNSFDDIQLSEKQFKTLIAYIDQLEQIEKSCRFKARMKLEEEIQLLKRENKALADDNEMKCELNEKLSKALDKACIQVAWLFDDMERIEFTWNFEEWKEYFLNEVKEDE